MTTGNGVAATGVVLQQREMVLQQQGNGVTATGKWCCSNRNGVTTTGSGVAATGIGVAATGKVLQQQE